MGRSVHEYSRPSKVEHNPFQEAVRLPVCSTFKLNEHEPHDAVQCCAHGSTFEFLFEFQTEFFSNFLFEFQVVRESNRSTFEGPLYFPSLVRNEYNALCAGSFGEYSSVRLFVLLQELIPLSIVLVKLTVTRLLKKCPESYGAPEESLIFCSCRPRGCPEPV
jgi:hypothetical protein